MTPDTKSHKSRKVAVLGPMPRDHIVTDDGERFEKYGCALYTAVALSALLDAGDTIVPISHVRRKDEVPLKQILASFPNIDTSCITSSADQGDTVELRYIGQNRRLERQTGFMNPILRPMSPRSLTRTRLSVFRSRITRWGRRRCGTSRRTAARP